MSRIFGQFTPHLKAVFQKGKKRPVDASWRMGEMYIKIQSQWKQSLRVCSRSMAFEPGELAGKLTIVSSEFSDKKNVNSSLNLKMPDAKITPLLKKMYALFFAPQVGGHFYQLGLLN